MRCGESLCRTFPHNKGHLRLHPPHLFSHPLPSVAFDAGNIVLGAAQKQLSSALTLATLVLCAARAQKQLSFDVVKMNLGIGPWRVSIPLKEDKPYSAYRCVWTATTL